MIDLSRIRKKIQSRPPIEEIKKDRNAGVFVLFTQEENPKILFLKRAANLNEHPGEICFPGGKIEDSDISILRGAYRELEEETSITADHVDFYGSFDPLLSKHKYSVTPFFGAIPLDANIDCHPAETEAKFLIPFHQFLQKKNYWVWERERDSVLYRSHCFSIDGIVIWGLTAKIIVRFICFIYDSNLFFTEEHFIT